jgi:hypothetical protein
MAYGIMTAGEVVAPLLGMVVGGELSTRRLRVTVAQRFGGLPGDALFAFPLPEGASMLDAALTLDGRALDATLVTREQAAARLGQARLAGCGTALGDAPRVLLAPLGELAAAEAHLEVRYSQRLREREGAASVGLIPAPVLLEPRPDASRSPRPEVRWRDAAGAARVVTLGGAPILIGRDPACGVRVDDPRVHLRQAVFTFERGRHWITNLTSIFPLSINERLVFDRAVLAAGDVVLLGDTRLSLSGPEPAAATTPPGGLVAELALDLGEAVEIASPTHPIELGREGGAARVRLASQPVPLDRDLVLEARREVGPGAAEWWPLVTLVVGEDWTGAAGAPRAAEVLARQLPSGLWGPPDGDEAGLARETHDALAYLAHVAAASPGPAPAPDARIRAGVEAAVALARRVAAGDPPLGERLLATALALRNAQAGAPRS